MQSNNEEKKCHFKDCNEPAVYFMDAMIDHGHTDWCEYHKDHMFTPKSSCQQQNEAKGAVRSVSIYKQNRKNKKLLAVIDIQDDVVVVRNCAKDIFSEMQTIDFPLYTTIQHY